MTTNALGSRGREPAPPQPGQTRLLLLGDSMVFGDGLEESETIAARLESLGTARGRDLVAYNGALSGMDSVQELLVARNLGPLLQPDLVVLGYFVSNDPLANTIARVDSAGRYAVDEQAAARLRAELIDRLDPWLDSRAVRAALLPFLMPRLRYSWSAQPEVVARSCDLVQETAAASLAVGARFAALILYGRDGTAGGLSDAWSGSRRVGRRLGRCLEARGVQVLDSTGFMDGRADRNDCYFERDGHLNPEGARRVAAAIFERVVAPAHERTGP